MRSYYTVDSTENMALSEIDNPSTVNLKPSTTDDSTNSHGRPIPGWPSNPQLLGHTNSLDAFLHISEVMWDVLLSLSAIVFLVLAVLSVRLDGHMIEERPWGMQVISASKYGPTVFPILFAMIIGKTLKNIARWRIEHGERIGVLEQLLGSTTLAATLETQFQVRVFGLTSVALILLWVLSPLGGQSSLRVLRISDVKNTTAHDVAYASTYYDMNNFTIVTGGQSYDEISINTLMATTLMSPAASKNGSMDIWGNLKIPLMASLIDSTQDKDGWLPVPEKNATYASLVGIPLRGLPREGNVSFQMENPYMTLECDDLEFIKNEFRMTNVSDDLVGIRDGEWTGMTSSMSSPFALRKGYQFWQLSTNLTTNGRETPKPGLVPRTVMFESNDFDGLTRAKCHIYTTYVELDVFCEQVTSHCSVLRMRQSERDNPPREWTYLDLSMTSFMFSAAGLTTVLPLGNSRMSTVIQAFFVNPNNPFVEIQGRNMIDSIAKIGSSMFATRLSQLMNTYYITGVLPYDVQGSAQGATSIKTGDGREANSGKNYTTVSGAHTVIHQRYVYDRAWLAVLVISSFLMVVLGVTGAVIGALCYAPDILTYMSSLTRDNPYIPTPQGGSAMTGGERARLLKNMRVRLGDVNPENNVGHVAIGAMDLENVGRLKKGRIYI
ncbi:hypothetical protein EDC01DRAFT_702806 [Geopyxis carbonaria]|nr:hypothetical protein EDC01DRAFT_702806 [Geopyxis carbonaria]